MEWAIKGSKVDKRTAAFRKAAYERNILKKWHRCTAAPLTNISKDRLVKKINPTQRERTKEQNRKNRKNNKKGVYITNNIEKTQIPYNE